MPHQKSQPHHWRAKPEGHDSLIHVKNSIKSLIVRLYNFHPKFPKRWIEWQQVMMLVLYKNRAKEYVLVTYVSIADAYLLGTQKNRKGKQMK